MTHLLNCISAYPNDGILHRKSHMQLVANSDARYLNENQAKSRTSENMCVSENAPIPALHGVVITIAKIMKHVMSSAAKAELASLFIAAKNVSNHVKHFKK